MKDVDSKLPRTISWIAGVVAILVAVALPLGYLVVEYQENEAALETETKIGAWVVSELISAGPELRNSRRSMVEEYLYRLPWYGDVESRRIVDTENRVLAEAGGILQSPVIFSSAPVLDADVVVGRIEIGRSLRPVLSRTGGIAVLGLMLALAVFVSLRVWPMRALYRALANNRRLLAEAEQTAREQAALSAIATATSQSLQIDQVLRIALDKVLEVTGREHGYIRLKDSATGSLKLAAHRGISEPYVDRLLQQRTPGEKSDQVFESGEPLVIDDPDGSRLKAEVRNEGSRAMGWFPLKASRQTVGILNVSSTQPVPFQPREVELLKAIGNVIGVTLENARLFEKAQRNLAGIRALHDIDKAIASTLDLSNVLDVLLEKIDLTLPYSAATIRLVSSDGILEPVACRNLDEQEWKSERGKLGRGLANAVLKGNVAVVIRNAMSDPRVNDPEFYRKHKLTSYLGVPLAAKGKVLGVLGFYTKEEHEFSADEIEFLATLAGQAAIAINNAELYEQAKTREAQLLETNRMLSALHAVAVAASQSVDLSPTLQASIEKITEHFRFDAVRIHVHDERTGEIRLRASLGKDPDRVTEAKSFKKGEGIVGRVVQSGEPLIFEDVESDPLYRQLSRTNVSHRFGYRFFAVFPIRGKLRSLGTLGCVGAVPRRMSSGEVQLLEAIADRIGVAFENSELYEQLRQKVDELQQKTMELELANKGKSEFLSVMSHELRTPLNVTMGYTSMVREGMFGEINPEQSDVLDKALRASKDLLAMVDEILQATQIEARALDVTSSEINVSEFMDDLRASCEVCSGAKQEFRWDCPGDLVVWTDAQKLKQVLHNLINNAIKFTARGAISVSARQVAGNGVVEFKVADTGIGIARENLSKIFDMFQQVDSSETRLYGGVGLGLYIVKNFTEMLGGRVEVESELGKGSTFRVTIPSQFHPSGRPSAMNAPCG